MKRFDYSKIQDNYVRQSIKDLIDEMNSQKLLKGKWEHFQITFTAAETKVIPHKLGYKPLDIMVTSTTGAGTVTFNYGSFTKDNISLTSTGECVIRFYAGNHQENDA